MTANGEKRFSYALLVFFPVAIYLSVVAFPTLFSIWLSLTDYNGGKIFGNPNIDFVGLKNYIWMFTQPGGYFFTALWNNLYVVAVSVFGQIPLGFMLAYVLSRKLIKHGLGFFQSMIYLPNVISSIIIGVLFNALILSRESVWMEIKKIFDSSAQFTNFQNPMIPVLVVVLWMYTGFYMLLFLANMQRIDPSIVEAARIDGAKESAILRHITLPALSGVIITSSILAISGSLRSFDLVYAMTKGGPAKRTMLLAVYMYESAFGTSPNYPLANAISTVMVLISVVLIFMTRYASKVIAGMEE